VQESQTVRRFELLQFGVAVHLVIVSRRRAAAGRQGLARLWLSVSATMESCGGSLSALLLV